MLQKFYALSGFILALREHPRVKRVLSRWHFLLIILTLFAAYLGFSGVLQNPFTLFGDSFLIRSSLYFFNSDIVTSLLQFFSLLANATPYGFRKILLFVHLINAALVFLVAKKYGERLGNQEVFFPAFFAMVLFLTSPIIVENVAWISTIKESMGATLLLLGLFSLERYAAEKKITDYLFVFIIQCVLVFINPFLLVLPFITYLYFLKHENNSWENIFFWIFPLMLIPVLYLNIDADFAYWFASLRKSTIDFFPALGLRLQALGFYVSNLFYGTGRVVDYGWSLERAPQEVNRILVVAGGLFLLCSCMLYFIKKNWRIWLLPLVLFTSAIIFDLRFLSLRFEAYATPSSDVILRSIVGDRYLYLPFLLLLTFGCPLLGIIWQRQVWRRISFAVVAVFVCGGLFLQHQLLENWTRNSTLIKHTYDISKFSYDALMRIGKSLENSGELAYADSFFIEAIEREPNKVAPIERLVHYYIYVGKTKIAEKIFLQATFEQKKLDVSSFLELAAANMLTDNIFDAEIILLTGIKNYPENKLLIEQYTSLLKKKKIMERDAYETLGHYASFKNNFDEAQKYLLKAYSIDPNNPRMKDATRLYLDVLKIKILKDNQAKKEAQKGIKNGNTKQDTKNP